MNFPYFKVKVKKVLKDKINFNLNKEQAYSVASLIYLCYDKIFEHKYGQKDDCIWEILAKTK